VREFFEADRRAGGAVVARMLGGARGIFFRGVVSHGFHEREFVGAKNAAREFPKSGTAKQGRGNSGAGDNRNLKLLDNAVTQEYVPKQLNRFSKGFWVLARGSALGFSATGLSVAC